VDEARLSFPRRKPRSIAVSLGYRAWHLAKRVLGGKRVLGFLLDCAWLSNRLAIETGGELYGDEIADGSWPVTEDLLSDFIPRGGAVIDIGCAQGRLARRSARYAARVVGIDRDRHYLDRARREYAADNITYVEGDFTRDLGDEHFDVALLSNVLEHVDDVDQLLRQVRRVADTVIVQVPDFEADMVNRLRLKLGRPFYSDGDHVREYTVAMLRAHLERNGWTPLRIQQRGAGIAAVAVRAPDADGGGVPI
jgi:SAM-dependent methyltransferase